MVIANTESRSQQGGWDEWYRVAEGKLQSYSGRYQGKEKYYANIFMVAFRKFDMTAVHWST